MNRRLALGMLGIVAGAGLLLAAQGHAAQNPAGQQGPPAAAPPPQQPPAPGAGGAPAQPPARPGAQLPNEEGAPLNKLGLSDEQKKQIHEIRKQTEKQIQDVRGNTSLTEQQQRQQIRQLRRGAHQQVEGVLTPDQREKYNAWLRAQRQRHRRQPQQQPQSPSE